jgi:hypothetical protein
VIIGAHSILYSRNPDADRAFLRDVLRFPSVDVGGGWLIFGLPPAEVAVHPSDENDVHELYLMCDDVKAFIADMKKRGIACGPLHSPDWGVLTHVMLPGGGELGVYEPRHARPKTLKVGKPVKKSVKRKPASRTAARSAGRRKPRNR